MFVYYSFLLLNRNTIKRIIAKKNTVKKIPTLMPALKIPPITLHELMNREAINMMVMDIIVFITVYLNACILYIS
ncbi:hypothetical protein CHU_2067 [Cytophaga hutchinsonii ATCC 33406]|uniref:Uncharacterized protein n=1 Tax=Cytophaga hutchinsonii (strain ATCC 33406 / DSM 1761 / CIP 103989 / NBRC 15051 / NCIMB 9469 / D465) TaxID=269798 RepID=A0A6N4SSE8_CYTH3|nr:hypothetical protein CHU_2067 [Cytophaga hutchinsonii ATCC 33406]